MLQLGIAALVIGGFVLLALKGADTTGFMALVAPILGAVFVINHLGKQDEVLGQIHENTNGVLSKKIKDAVAEALSERDDG
ncbi:hypothetical protein ACZ90_00265 [Streptomyces albus subsp. albus]|nr:hypothetical protein ACZ90_00265 [Streptomyces albus subsp. albus]